MNFSNQRLDGAEFRNCSLANAIFDDVNLAGAKLTNVNLSGLVIEDANSKGLKIFGYDVESWIRSQLANDGCHPDRAGTPSAMGRKRTLALVRRAFGSAPENISRFGATGTIMWGDLWSLAR